MTLRCCIVKDYTPNNWCTLYTTIICSEFRTGSRDIGHYGIYYGIEVCFYNESKIQIEVI